MCSMLSVLLTLKMGLATLQVLALFAPCVFKPPDPFPQLQCLHRSDQSHVLQTVTNIEIKGRGRFLNMPTGGLQ